MRYIAVLTISCLHFGLRDTLAEEGKKPVADASLSTPYRLTLDQEQRVLHSLSQRIKVEANDAPLSEVIHFISQSIDREILIDVPGLADAGISTDQNTTFHLGEMTVWQTFHFLLKPFQLAWTAHDGILEITTKEKADEQMITRVYDVRKLCELLEPISKEILWQRQNHPRNDAGMSGGAGGGGVGGGMMGGGIGGGGMFSVPVQTLVHSVIGMGTSGDIGVDLRRSVPVMTDPMSIESLLANVIPSLALLKWMHSDGEGGSIQAGQGCLIVRQSYQGQFQIAGILEGLEQILNTKGPLKSTPLQRIGYPHEEDAAILASLNKLKNLEIDNLGLETALQQIAVEAGCRLLIDSPALADEGISSDQPVIYHFQKLPLGICLKKLLSPLQLTYVVEEGVLVITTVAKADEMTSIRVYDIGNCNKIPQSLSQAGLLQTLVEFTSGKWLQSDGEGGATELVSSRHLLVLQTQRVHSEIEFLIEELSTEKTESPAKPTLKLRIHAAPDTETATDLLQVLPRLLAKDWNAGGSINQAGKSLLINQTPRFHDQVEEIILALEISRRNQYSTQHPPVNPPNTNPPTAK